VTVRVSWAVAQAPLPEEDVVRAVEAALDHGGRPRAELEVVLVDDATLADLHARFHGDPTPTDVIAFDLGPEGGGPEGEIYVSVDRALAVARERRSDERRELALYLVHGALHLCGFDDGDEVDRRAMREAESSVLQRLGYAAE